MRLFKDTFYHPQYLPLNHGKRANTAAYYVLSVVNIEGRGH